MHVIAKKHRIEDLESFVNEHKDELKPFQDRAIARQAQPTDVRAVQPERTPLHIEGRSKPPHVVPKEVGSRVSIEVSIPPESNRLSETQNSTAVRKALLNTTSHAIVLIEQPAIREDDELYEYEAERGC
jgi:hypothetical protein